MGKNIIIKLEQFINENKDTNNVISEIIDGEIRVYEKSIRELFNSIGGGINDVDFDTRPNGGDYQNEVVLTLDDNSWGGVSVGEWKKAEDILEKLIKDKFIQDYTINPSKNNITLEFDGNLPMGW